MSKCLYCNAITENFSEYAEPARTLNNNIEAFKCCSDECANKARAFIRYTNRMLPLFIIGIILSVFLMIAGVLIKSLAPSIPLLVAIGFFILGLTIAAFPFATPQTFSLWGVKKTVKIMRSIGVILIAFAIAFGVWLN